jgi:hypothetical protein
VTLRTLTRVALARAGVHNASTGRATITVDDLREMVRAAADPQTGRSVVKIGHLDPRFKNPKHDGEPVYGQVMNLSVDGDTLYGDLVNVPARLADAMPSAYPSRSVEVAYNFRTRDGRVHRRVLQAVSLLGATPPAIRDLDDLAVSHASEGVPPTDESVLVYCSALDDAGVPPSEPPVPHDAPRAPSNGPGGPMTAVFPPTLLTRLGLAEDADEAAVLAAVDALAAATPPAAPPAPPVAPVVPIGEGAGRHSAPEPPVASTDAPPAIAASAGTVLTPAQVATFSEMAAQLQTLQERDAARTLAEANSRIDGVIHRFSADPVDGGRVTPVTEPLWRTQLARDFDGTVALLAASPRLYSPTSLGAATGIPVAGSESPTTAHERALATARELGLRVFETPKGA